MLFSDLRRDYVRSCFQRLATAPFEAIEGLYAEMEAIGRQAVEESAVQPRRIVIQRYADMRYVGQEHAVTVELDRGLFEKQDRTAPGGDRNFDAVLEIGILEMLAVGKQNDPDRSPGVVVRARLIRSRDETEIGRAHV